MAGMLTVLGLLSFVGLAAFTVVLFVQGARAGERRRLRRDEDDD